MRHVPEGIGFTDRVGNRASHFRLSGRHHHHKCTQAAARGQSGSGVPMTEGSELKIKQRKMPNLPERSGVFGPYGER